LSFRFESPRKLASYPATIGGVVVSTLDPTLKRSIRPLSVRRHVNRKILRFSLASGLVAALLTACVYIASAYPSVLHWKDINLRTLSKIPCSGATCDTSRFSNDWQSDNPDYILDTQTRYFINVPTSTPENPERFAPLDYSNTAFIAKFRQPLSYSTPDQEVWRLYSRQATLDGRNLEIIIGYAEKAPWKMIDTPRSLIEIVDATLKREADEIAASLPSLKGVERGARSGPSADGFQVVDASTKEVVEGLWLPTFLPEDTRLPMPGWQFYVNHGHLYVVLTDTTKRLVATSLVPVGDLRWLGALVAFAFISTFVIARALSLRFLRGYFAITGIQVPALEEALRTGEGQFVEFKRGLCDDERRTGDVEDELLKSIAAFANTNDGVIFIGIDDAGHVRGLVRNLTEKDRFERKIYQLVRNRIRPRPPIQVAFDDIRGLLIARIIVARGHALAYMMGGVIYIRNGSADIQAQPEDLGRLIAEYAV
jgi:hypothetical protein